MTHKGVHRSDWGVLHHEKGPGENCSTGEQKILLMGIVLSFLRDRLLSNETSLLMLFDECVSHFDFHHRMVLFDQIRLLHEQKENKGTFHPFLTGTDRALFDSLMGAASFYHVLPSSVQKTA